jgi:hypothetical protein
VTEHAHQGYTKRKLSHMIRRWPLLTAYTVLVLTYVAGAVTVLLLRGG